jgi:hypothetical protein
LLLEMESYDGSEKSRVLIASATVRAVTRGLVRGEGENYIPDPELTRIKSRDSLRTSRYKGSNSQGTNSTHKGSSRKTLLLVILGQRYRNFDILMTVRKNIEGIDTSPKHELCANKCKFHG